jgi:multicomponent Na+:H+ antiporter subunit E
MNQLLALPRRLYHGLAFLVFFTRELVIANLRVAWEIITPGLRLSPAIVRVPIDCRTDWETMLLANAVTMTPGTLSLEVDTTDGALFVHSLYVTDRTEFVASIHKMEHMLLRVMRATPPDRREPGPTGATSTGAASTGAASIAAARRDPDRPDAGQGTVATDPEAHR